MKRKKFVVPLILLGLAGFMFLACDGSSGTPDTSNPQKVEETSDSESTSDSDEVAQEVFKMNDAIQLGDHIVQVVGIEDPYVEASEYSQPDAGNKYVAVEVIYENPTADKTIDYNPYDWKLFDSEGYSFEETWSASKEPSLSSGTLNAGSKVRGWITFEVPASSSNFKIQFSPSWLSSENVEIELY